MKFKEYKKVVLNNRKKNKLSFKITGKKHYVYRITDKKTNEHYYGSRTTNQADVKIDFWKYCTSSKRKRIIKNNPNNYKLKIIKIYKINFFINVLLYYHRIQH